MVVARPHRARRLLITSVLSVLSSADFLFLLEQTGLTRGNLSSHLRKLEESSAARRPRPSRTGAPRPAVAYYHLPMFWLAGLGVLLVAIVIYDVTQRHHAILRNLP